MKNNDEKLKQEMLDKITEMLQEIGKQLQTNTEINVWDKATQMDVMLDTLHFLQDYDENVRVLNKYWVEKRRTEKWNKENSIR